MCTYRDGIHNECRNTALRIQLEDATEQTFVCVTFHSLHDQSSNYERTSIYEMIY